MTSPDARTWAHYTAPSFVDVDDIRVAYRRQGTGERVLFLNSDGFSRTWLPFYEELSKKADVIVPEHPGYGDTPLTDGINSFDDLVLHYDEFLRALDLDEVHLVGHGLGGWLAADLAVTYPTRFKSLTLITPTGLRLVDTASIDTFRKTPEERRELQFNGRAAGYAELLEQEGEVEDSIRATIENAATGRLSWNPRYDFRLDRRLRRVLAPTAVLGAEDDRWVPTAMAARFAELIPGARLFTVKGQPGEPSGHLPHIEDAANTAKLVLAHVASNA